MLIPHHYFTFYSTSFGETATGESCYISRLLINLTLSIFSLKIAHLIAEIASSLPSSPQLLRGLNIVLPKGFQVEINADLRDQFDFFVLVTPIVSRIMLVSGLKVPSPETNHELRSLLSEPQGINKLLEIEARPAWFSAISQLLQNVCATYVPMYAPTLTSVSGVRRLPF
jgi:hypothetical protein